MQKRNLVIFFLLVFLMGIPGAALAQDYSFGLEQENVHVFWNEDGTSSIDYVFVFNNDPGASPIEYVDVGLPNPNFDESSIQAEVNGNPVTDISASGFQGSGPGVSSGVAVGLGRQAIPPGETGQVHVFIGTQRDVLRPDSRDNNYASAVFSPAWFEPVHGNTNLEVTFHLPPGVQPEEPRWHEAPGGFPSEPETGLDDQGRVTYTWRSPSASMDRNTISVHLFPGSTCPNQPSNVLASWRP
jgi:hypothetical protein